MNIVPVLELAHGAGGNAIALTPAGMLVETSGVYTVGVTRTVDAEDDFLEHLSMGRKIVRRSGGPGLFDVRVFPDRIEMCARSGGPRVAHFHLEGDTAKVRIPGVVNYVPVISWEHPGT